MFYLQIVYFIMKKSILISFFINLNVFFLFAAYEVGDTISIADQNIEHDVCSGDYVSDKLKLSDFNGNLNGGQYMVTSLLIQATW